MASFADLYFAAAQPLRCPVGLMRIYRKSTKLLRTPYIVRISKDCLFQLLIGPFLILQSTSAGSQHPNDSSLALKVPRGFGHGHALTRNFPRPGILRLIVFGFFFFFSLDGSNFVIDM